MAEDAKQIKDIIEKVKKELIDLTGFSSPSAVGVKGKDNSWVLTIQVIEKTSIPESMDLLGVYEVETDREGNILGYERVELRRRADTKEREGGAKP